MSTLQLFGDDIYVTAQKKMINLKIKCLSTDHSIHKKQNLAVI